jgi:uncharacterized protein YjbI with pentapeptide repeats
MNPLIVLRGVAGAALPVALGVTYWKQRRSRHRYPEEKRTGSADSSDSSSQMTRTALRAYVGRDRNLRRVDLRRADLSGLDLSDRDLAGLDFSHSNLAGTDLSKSRLLGCILDHAEMSRCKLAGADLTAASVHQTSFWRADLRGADLGLCRSILMANFRGATYDAHTRWPKDFDPEFAGARLIRR